MYILTIVVPLAKIESMSHDSDFKAWDLVLQKNEALQAGDWKNMTLDEKKAGNSKRWWDLRNPISSL